MEKEKQQELIFKLSVFEQQAQQLQQQLQAVEQGIIEINSLSLGLDEIKGKIGGEIFAPIGRGIFAKTKLDSEELLVDVGGKNFVKKSIPETKKLIENQIKNLEDIRKDLENSIEEVNQQLTDLVLEARKQSGREKD